MGEQLRSVRSKVMGVRSSAGPLNNVAITFGDGVTALYGRNGAGKTWGLNAIRESLAGRAAAGTHLLVSVADNTEQQIWLYNLLYHRAAREQWDESDGPLVDFMTIALRKWFEEVDRRFPVREGRRDVPEQMIEELARSQYLVLVPTGVTDQRWDVWVCADPRSTDFPVTATELDRFDQIERTTSTLLGDIDDIIEESPKWQDLASSLERQIQECQKATTGQPEDLSDSLQDVLTEMRKVSGDPTEFELEQAVNDWSFRAPLNWLVTPVAGWIWQNESVGDDIGTFFEDSGRSFQKMQNDGLPMPIARVGQVEEIPWVLHDEAVNEDVDTLTARRFAVAMASRLPFGDDERVRLHGRSNPSLTPGTRAQPTVSVTPHLEEWVRDLAADANSILISLLQDGPELSLSLAPPHEWAIAAPLRWTSSRGKVSVHISELSTAERRWAQVAVRRALDRVSKEPDDPYLLYEHLHMFWPPRSMRYHPADLVMIDEPETALHRAAERHMALGLDGLTVSGPQVVVATHSPDVLNQPEACLVHVWRTPDGITAANQMVDVDLEGSVSELGMVPSDLIGMYRVFLLVEGEHDEIVVRALLSEVLEAARVKIIPMRGGKHLPSTVESQLLFDMTGAHVLALLDNVKAMEIDAVWQEAQERYLAGDADTAITYLAAQFKDRKGDEYKWIATWLSRALSKGVHERLVPYGLAAADIIEYLPVEIIVPKAGKSWRELRDEFETQSHKNFKDWLQRKYKADTSVPNIRRAAAAVPCVPEEFQSLGYRLREVSSRRT